MTQFVHPSALALYECPDLPASTVPRESMASPVPGWRTDYDPITDQFAVVQVATGRTLIYERVMI
jgi:hypothetical protein